MSTVAALQRTLAALVPVVGGRADLPVTVDRIGPVEQHPMPLARLFEEVAPRDRRIVRIIEAAVLNRGGDAVVDGADKATIHREAREYRAIAGAAGWRLVAESTLIARLLDGTR